jgi:hypothetical protein
MIRWILPILLYFLRRIPTRGLPGGVVGGVQLPPPRNTKLQLSPEPLTRGPLRPDPRSLCPLSSAEFVGPPPEQNSWVRH